MPSWHGCTSHVYARRTLLIRCADPIGDAHHVRPAVANLPAGQINHPAELPVRVLYVIGEPARRPYPHVVIETLGRLRIRRPIAIGTGIMPTEYFAHFAELPVANVHAGLPCGELRSSLRADLDDTPIAVSGSGIVHPPSSSVQKLSSWHTHPFQPGRRGSSSEHASGQATRSLPHRDPCLPAACGSPCRSSVARRYE